MRTSPGNEGETASSAGTIGSLSTACFEGGECLRSIAEAVGTSGGNLLSDPPRYLSRFEGQHGGTRASGSQPAKAGLPSIGAVKGWASRLLASDEPLDYVIEVRGLALPVVRRFDLGWDETHLTFPVFENGSIVNVRRRRPADGAEVRGLRGRGSQLYPDVPPKGPILLVAGEFDALVGRQLGLPTVTTTCGATLPEPLAVKLTGRRVAVMFDVGEEAKAAKAVALLVRVGAESAWVVRLSELGVPEGSDLNSVYLDGGTAEELLTLIRRERRRA